MPHHLNFSGGVPDGISNKAALLSFEQKKKPLIDQRTNQGLKKNPATRYSLMDYTTVPSPQGPFTVVFGMGTRVSSPL